MSSTVNRRFCIAPMLDWTDRHERRFLRILTRHALLYTEMVTTGALLYGDHKRYLQFNPEEHPVALQLGGSEPQAMATCARMAEDEGYDEVNINVGCPSERVQKGAFGACLMAEPELIADNVAAMKASVAIPVTVKNRIAIDEQPEYETLHHFIETVAAAGCTTFIIHARKAWLKGLSPKENRDVPPLDYELVYRIKQDFPQLEIILNGGITTLEQSLAHLEKVDGVMMGREAYHNPYVLAEVDRLIYGDTRRQTPERKMILNEYRAYMAQQLAQGVYLKQMCRHLLGLFNGQPGAKKWRRYLSENAHKPGAGLDIIEQAAALVGCD